jgi:hypothetical protein
MYGILNSINDKLKHFQNLATLNIVPFSYK